MAKKKRGVTRQSRTNGTKKVARTRAAKTRAAQPDGKRSTGVRSVDAASVGARANSRTRGLTRVALPRVESPPTRTRATKQKLSGPDEFIRLLPRASSKWFAGKDSPPAAGVYRTSRTDLAGYGYGGAYSVWDGKVWKPFGTWADFSGLPTMLWSGSGVDFKIPIPEEMVE